ncbi:hypothetical protein SDC9_75586 [bioreactor metagenome]|uniref:Uncharacterized protein n=1 Tax=bioreactor metagenome TaxID=1076179 RepID=A0A644YL64_9ZZZZ
MIRACAIFKKILQIALDRIQVIKQCLSARAHDRIVPQAGFIQATHRGKSCLLNVLVHFLVDFLHSVLNLKILIQINFTLFPNLID